MKKPFKVKIGAHTYEVEEVKDGLASGAELGQCDTIKQKILILEGLNETQYFATLLHESMHAMNAVIDHTLLDSLSEQIAQFLLDNNMVKIK